MRKALVLALALAAVCAAPTVCADEALSSRLGEIVAAARYDTLSPEVRARLDLTVADNLAVLASATRSHCSAPFIVYLKAKGGAREALVPGCSIWLPAEDAAAAIAYLIHAEEIDVSDFRGELRASAPIFAAAFATAQATNASGPEALTALAAGYSAQGALAAPFGPLQPRAMSSGIWGPIGAAAASSHLRGLDGPTTGTAIALAASASAGPFQYFFDQTEEKRVIIAPAARAGVEAADLAQRGETAALRVLEGRAGLFAWIDGARVVDPSAVAADVSRLDGPLYLYPKFFAASSSIIPFLEGLDPIWRARGLRPEDIDQVVLHAESAWGRVLREKIETFEAPKTAIGAKINFSYVLALYMALGRAMPGDFTPARLSDQEILALARKVRFEGLPVGGGSSMTLHLRSGEELRIAPVRISPAAPAPEARAFREAKFAALTSTLSEKNRRDLERLAAELGKAQSMRQWTARVARAMAP